MHLPILRAHWASKGYVEIFSATASATCASTRTVPRPTWRKRKARRGRRPWRCCVGGMQEKPRWPWCWPACRWSSPTSPARSTLLPATETQKMSCSTAKNRHRSQDEADVPLQHWLRNYTVSGQLEDQNARAMPRWGQSVVAYATAAGPMTCTSTSGFCCIARAGPPWSIPPGPPVPEQHRFLAKALELLPGTWVGGCMGARAAGGGRPPRRLRSDRGGPSTCRQAFSAARPGWSTSARTAVPVMSGKQAEFLDMILADQQLREKAVAAVDWSAAPHVWV